jgi:hypothetical protein
MKLIISTVPDEPAELATWLERQLTGPDLECLIKELTAVHGQETAPSSLAEALGEDLSVALGRGLGGLPANKLRMLLRHPRLLGELQDTIVESSSPYWDARFDHPELKRIADAARESSTKFVARPARTPIYRRPWFVSLATAAVVIVAVFLANSRERAASGWGWNKPGLMTAVNNRVDHLNALANAAEEWRSRPKSTTDELRKSLQEMRDGCTSMLAAAHPQLTPDDRAWLMDKCVAWGTKLDRHLADLQTGRPVEAVRREADGTIEALVQALRARASA